MDRERVIALVECEIRKVESMAKLEGEFAQDHLELATALRTMLEAYQELEPKENIMRLTIPGAPITKKNSQRIIRLPGGRPMIKPSKQFESYQDLARKYIPNPGPKIDQKVNLKCLYYMPTHRRVDLVNLLEATCDILAHYRILKDDHSGIVASHDGSRVLYDKGDPRVEIEIDRFP